MKNCKNCKFWKEDKEYHENFGDCLCDKFEYEGNLKKSDYDRYHLLYMDYEGYMARIKVHKDFGCIDFEELER